LTRVSITASGLPRQISHLSLSRLFCGKVCLLTRLRNVLRALLIGDSAICNLKFLVSYAVGQLLNV